MATHTITNNTGAPITLVDSGGPSVTLASGQSIQNAPITFSQINFGGAMYNRIAGSLVNGDSYSITFKAAAPAQVILTGNSAVVTFQ